MIAYMNTKKELEAKADEIMKQIATRQKEINKENNNEPIFVEDKELERLQTELQKIDEKLLTFDPF